jgi:porphobilinogen deaminase
VLATLEAGCSAPVGALADVVSDLTDDGRVVDRVFLRAVVGTDDGALLRASATGDLDDVEKLGAALAAELLDIGGGSDRFDADAPNQDAAEGGPSPAGADSVQAQSGVDR